jgi:hypothetical protein
LAARVFRRELRLVIAAAAVALVAFAVVRGLRQIFSGAVELDAGGSWGRQATSRQKRSGEDLSGWAAGARAALAALCFAAAITVIVLLVSWF